MTQVAGSLLPTYCLITTQPQVIAGAIVFGFSVESGISSLWKVVFLPEEWFSEHLLLSSLLIFIEHLNCVRHHLIFFM